MLTHSATRRGMARARPQAWETRGIARSGAYDTIECAMSNTVPMMLVSGFLGSGKTTFINHLLHEGLSGKKIAVIVNDFGSVSVDDSLISHPDDSKLVLRNGCVCCSLAGDLVLGLSRLLDDGDFDMVVMEASGISKVDSIRHVIEDPSEEHVRLTHVVVVVDAVRFCKMQGAIRTVGEQVENAGLVLLNRCDVASPGQIQETEDAITSLNPHVPIIKTTFAKTSIATVMRVGTSSRPVMQSTGDVLDEWETCQLVLSESTSREQLESLLVRLPESIARVKGFVATCGGDVLHVNHVPGETRIERWDENVPKANKNLLTVIGKPGFEQEVTAILPENALLRESRTLGVDHHEH
jgi:G3E family GTPase